MFLVLLLVIIRESSIISYTIGKEYRLIRDNYYNGLDPWFGLGHVTFIAIATGAHGAWPVCI